uniref:Uncharacterized protein n=1 Tax=Rhizophora mucronata TaxID=61149 RepID=A0A2P2QCN8_RHIMU
MGLQLHVLPVFPTRRMLPNASANHSPI